MLHSFEELCIMRVAAVNSFARGFNYIFYSVVAFVSVEFLMPATNTGILISHVWFDAQGARQAGYNSKFDSLGVSYIWPFA